MIDIWWLAFILLVFGIIIGWLLQEWLSKRQIVLERQNSTHWQQKHRVLNRKYRQQRQHIKYMKNMMQTLDEAVLQLDAQSNVLSINRCAKRVFGIRKKLLPCSMQVLYRDNTWLQHLQLALLENVSQSSNTSLDLDQAPQQLPNLHLRDEYVLSSRLLQVNGQNMLICLDISREYMLENQRERLISNLMHDMKTPLTSILGYARALHDFGDQADLRAEASEAIANEAHRLNSLLESLLTLDKIACTLPEPIALSWSACWQKVANSLEPLLTEHQIILKILQLDSDDTIAFNKNKDRDRDQDIYLYINASSAERCLLNVLENAVHYSPAHSSISVNIKTLNKYIRVQVMDEGMGVPEMALPRLTERFFRLQQIATIKGHGLGLAIVQDTMRQYGGKLQIANRSSGGLKVSLYFARVPES